ncbi:MAG: TonB family protein [Acidobacteria bacterium]|nr:TonB family protein [Acidobacteriota bacterium]
MFANLVESASHQKEFKRRGRFLLVTLAGYALVVMSLGVVSIYAYDTHLESLDLEFITLVTPVQAETPAPVVRNTAPRSSTNSNPRDTEAVRVALYNRVDNSTKVPDKVSSVPSNVPEIPISGRVRVGNVNSDPGFSGPPGSRDSIGESSNNSATAVKIDEPPPMREKPAPPPAQPTLIKKSVLLNSEAKSLPKPVYPQIAKAAHIQGIVNVQITIDESGRVISARATSGNPALYAAAVQAAYQARFTPTILNSVPVKVSGMINYNFRLD